MGGVDFNRRSGRKRLGFDEEFETDSTGRIHATRRRDDRSYTPVHEYSTTDDEETANVVWNAAYIFAESFYPLYAFLFEGTGFIHDYERKLTEANIRTTADLFVSGALGFGTVLGGIFGVIAAGLVYMGITIGAVDLPYFKYEYLPFVPPQYIDFLSPLKFPTALLIAALLGGLVGLLLGLATVLPYPYMKAMGRKWEIDLLMPDVVSFMYSLSVGGMNQLEIIEKVADSPDTYGEAAVEFQRIVQETQYFNVDYQTAIEKVARSTPSEDLRQFLIDMLSIINSGGSMEQYLEEQKQFYLGDARRKQEDHLNLLELFGEIYMTLSIVPMMALIILVVMTMFRGEQNGWIMSIVYIIIPFLNIVYVIIVSTVKQDEPGTGILESEAEDDDAIDSTDLLSVEVVDRYLARDPIFYLIRRKEYTHRFKQVLKNPTEYFRVNPTHTLLFTVPFSVLALFVLVATGSLHLSWEYTLTNKMWQSFGFLVLPLWITLVPLAVFHEWNLRTRGSIMTTLTEDLRKLANTNKTGQPLLESMRITAEDSNSLFSKELMTMYTKVSYGRPLRTSLIEFNNKYHIPRLARTLKLISKAQEASSQITEVLSTAAASSETQDYITRERRSRVRLQVIITAMTYFIFLAVILMMVRQFIGELAALVSQNAGGQEGFYMAGIDAPFITTMYLHASILQGILAGFVTGYMQNADLKSGAKYATAFTAICLGAWLLFV